MRKKKGGGRKKGEVAHQKATESVVGELCLQAPRAPDSFPSHESQGSQASELCILIESNLWNFPSRSAILVLARGRVLRQGKFLLCQNKDVFFIRIDYQDSFDHSALSTQKIHHAVTKERGTSNCSTFPALSTQPTSRPASSCDVS